MATYRITGPDGSVYNVTAPDGDSQDEVLKNFHASLAVSSKAKTDTAAWDEKVRGDLTGNMSAAGKFVAGYGSAVPRLARGIGQRLGLVSQADADEANARDKPLLATGAGSMGNIGGNIAAAIPTVAIPGAASLTGAAAIGAGLGFIQPTSSNESVLKNTAIGGVAGPLGVLGGRAVGAVYQGGKALVEPFYQAGRDRIAGRMIQRFAEDPSKVAQATSTPTMTGARPTLAEQTGDRGLAQLQDSLRSVDPQIANQLAARTVENNAARVNALRGLAGEDGARDFAVAERGATAEQLYGSAFSNKAALSPSQLKAQADLLNSNRIGDLMKSPAIQDAMKAAQTNAANAGKTLDTSGSIEGLHNMKLAIDDMIKDPQTAAQVAKVAGLKAAQKKLVDVIETLSPEYKAARVTYSEMSKPINSFDVAAQVAKKGLSNGSDLSGTSTINRNALMGALKDEPALIRQATGRRVGKSLSDVMEPQDLSMLRAIASETNRSGAVAAAGNGPGSATASRMASQNLLRQLVGPTGLPSSWGESVLANTLIGKPFNLLYGGVAEPKIQQALAQAVLDPAKAQAMLAAATPAQRPALLQLLQRSAAARTSTAVLANRP